MNFEVRELTATGIVRPEDVTSNNTIAPHPDRRGAHFPTAAAARSPTSNSRATGNSFWTSSPPSSGSKGGALGEGRSRKGPVFFQAAGRRRFFFKEARRRRPVSVRPGGAGLFLCGRAEPACFCAAGRSRPVFCAAGRSRPVSVRPGGAACFCAAGRSRPVSVRPGGAGLFLCGRAEPACFCAAGRSRPVSVRPGGAGLCHRPTRR